MDERINVSENNVTPPTNLEMKVRNYRAYRFVYYALGFVEVILALRFFLKLAGANPQNIFAEVIYGVTSLLLLPFKGLFPVRAVTEGEVVLRTFEFSTLVAMVVYALIAWGIAKWIIIFKSKPTK
jgi:hypothetical protein